ncbi:uncharacterized protein I206_106841 [Kwoniella pini CBS 10737]|uniref:Uncharacterized protein n=1 Tax=Kwoniella pini CBS 10737 TaxID=1296096 RepID=A0A1B9HZW9_9TREE|nr:uncharacterized protein I206_05614 [Kwoniella pini CBS 10737]OCF48833.1 hypothetical protein I206_05614 [Kwoniella pini CBS 10737]
MLKDIVERPSKPPVAPSAPVPSSSSSGFPLAVHRSQRPSAFAKARHSQAARAAGEQAAGQGKAVDVPPTLHTSQPHRAHSNSIDKLSEVEEVRRSVQDENARRVEGMTQIERDGEVEELKERFGSGIVELMRKRKEARESTPASGRLQQEHGQGGAADQVTQGGMSESGPSSRPFEIGDTQDIIDQVSVENRRKVDSMNQLEREQEVEELEERFGGNLMDALRKRAQAKASQDKGKEKEKEKQQVSDREISLQVGSQPPISRPVSNKRPPHRDDPSLSELKQFFPSVPSEPSKLAWLQPVSSSSADSSTSPRFDLSGNILSSSEQNELPQHLGLHHHGSSPDLAGYTMQEITHLCRSTVPSQKITMMNTLSRVISRYHQGAYSEVVITEIDKHEGIKRSIELGVEILAGLSRGISVIESGVDLLYEALNGSSWSWMNGEQDEPMEFTPDRNQDLGVSSIPFEDVLPRLKELLSIEDGFSNQTVNQLMLIIRRATFLSKDSCESLCPLIPAILKAHIISRPWPPSSTSSTNPQYPSVEAMRLLRDITTSSRACAEELLGQGVYESTLRFVVTATWVNDMTPEAQQYGQELALEVLGTYTSLGRYGSSSNVVTSSSEIWRLLGQWVNGKLSTTQNGLFNVERDFIKAYFSLLEIWITCAIDPHRTTPEHDLTWAQVGALKWEDEAVHVIRQSTNNMLLAQAVATLCAWAKGIKINGVKNGEAERALLLDALKDTRLGQMIDKIVNEVNTEQSVRTLLANSLRLHRLLLPTGQLLPDQIIDSIRARFAFSVQSGDRKTTHIQYELLLLSITSPPTADWLSSALHALQAFQAGDEPLALELLDVVLKSDLRSGLPEISKLSHTDGLQVIRPLLQYQILPNVDVVVSPCQPSHLYLKATSSLRQVAQVHNEEKPALPGLPLGPDWIWSPLNELLRSGTSEAIQQTPNDWQVSEVTLVQATLILAKAYYGSQLHELDRARIVFGLMKVHMLEHGQTSSNAVNEVEVFRDGLVSEIMHEFMGSLVKPEETDTSLTIEAESKEGGSSGALGLEKISTPFLGTGVPFYQFYQDFLELYESISFSDKLFTQLLIPVFSMEYPRDYRKLIWVDHCSSLKNIRLTLKDIPLISSEGIRSYFKPYEEDKEILTTYARALISGQITKEQNSFLYALAVNHLAALFWLGLEEDRDSTRVGILIMILLNGKDGVIKDLLDWNFIELSFADNEEETKKRKELVKTLTGDRGRKRVEGL